MPRHTFTSFVFCAFLFGCGASAATDAEHTAVETAICDDLPMACLCHGRTLRVSTGGGKAMQCGESQAAMDMMRPPTVLPPAGVTLDPAAKYFLMIIDRDAPSRMSPGQRYWLHGLFVDISATDVKAGNILNGDIKMRYAGPTPPPTTGAHSYQILLMKQPIAGIDTQGVSAQYRGQFDASRLLHTNQMCGDTTDFLVGSFEFTCSTPDGLDPMNPERPCVKSTAGTTTTTTAAAASATMAAAASTGKMTTSVAGKTTAMNAAETTAMNAAETTAMNAAETTAMNAAETKAMNAAETTAMNAAETMAMKTRPSPQPSPRPRPPRVVPVTAMHFYLLL